MSSTKDVFKIVNVSKQLTKTASVFTKLEWRIEDFRKLMRLYQRNQSISSKTFILPHLNVVWQLDVYPRGINQDGYVDFRLRLIGFKESDGSFSADTTKTVMVDYEIFVRNSANDENARIYGNDMPISKEVSDFKIDASKGANLTDITIKRFTHSDGSLLVICEIECLAPGDTFSMEPSLNSDLLDQNRQLTDHIGKMWKSKLFADCTLKVGAKSFPAHKCILGQWSEVFQKMFSLPTEEAKTGIVEIEDFIPDAINAMLEYMYTGMVKNEVMEKLALVAELLAVADKYDVIPLKEMCEVFLASKLTSANVLDVFIFADRYSAAKIKTACANRLAIDGQPILQSKEWEDLNKKDKELANELLELMIKDHPSFGDVQEEVIKNAK